MSAEPTPSDRVPGPLEDYLELRASLTDGPIGEGGRQVCAALTSCFDVAVQALASDLDPDGRFTLVAIGGYGRAELSPYSDIDIMILHQTDDPSELAAALFRPLWDSGLRLGHAVRTPKEAADAARQRVDTHTTLLTSRLVYGDQDLFAELSSEIASVTRARPLRRHLVAMESERRTAAPYLLMSTDVKNGRGGLRTLQGFEWERRREELIGRFSAQPDPKEEAAHESLLAIRNALHIKAGRSYDEYSLDLREPVARWLGSDVHEVSERLVRATSTGDRLASQRWPELVENGDSMARRLWARMTGTDPRMSEPPAAATPSDLASILRSGERGRETFERLQESGRIDEFLPEWEAVRHTPQLAPFHDHPVDAHLWRTVDEMQSLITGDDGHYSAIAAEIGMPDALTLSAFLHDIGKGRGGDHSEVGAAIAERVCMRFACDPELSRLVVGAVRLHLLLSEAATRRDIDDPAVVDEVAEAVGDLRLLQVLYLLTVADSRATGPTMWSEWKARLVRTLFIRCAALFGADQPLQATGTTEGEVLAGTPPQLHAALRAHIDGLPPEYLRSTPSDDVLWHFSLIDKLDGRSNLGFRADGSIQTAVVVGISGGGFRRLVAEAFAANGIDVLEARLHTRADGLVVDSFQVRDDRTGLAVSEDRWRSVSANIESALAGDLDTRSKLVARAEAYSSVSPEPVPTRVALSIDEASGEALVTVKCSDRIGRLAQILTTLGDFDFDIRLAKLDSRGGEVVDTFHVRSSTLPADDEELRLLEGRIADSIQI